ELRGEFNRESEKTGRPRLLLTMAVPAGIEYIDKGYDIPKLNRYLDFMNILSYDYHSAFEPAVNHHSPLYPLEEDSEYNFDSQLSIDYTISHYLKLGADRNKLVLGIPTYGRSYTLFNPLATEIGSPADGPGEQGDATREKGYLAYYEICDNLKDDGWKVEQPNSAAMGPYAYKGNQWVGYDDIDIIKLKSRYVSENGLGGIMFWSIDNDDFRGKCHGRPYPLIEAGKEALLAASAHGSNDVVSATPSRGSTKSRPKRPPGGGSTSTGSGSGRQGPQGQRPHKKGRPTGDLMTKLFTTPEPPTTPDPGSDFMCKDEGFFPHPRDCKKYFWCLDSGPSNLGIVAHQFTCPSGLFFNKGADSCDYARNVVCKKKPAGSTTTTKPTPATSTAKSTTKYIPSTTTTTTTTTTTPEPPPEDEEYEDEEYADEIDEPEEDPKVIKELVNLIKKLGGVEQLEKHLHLQDSDKDTKSGQVTTSGFSRSLYDRVLNRATNNKAPSADSTTPRYSSVYRNRPIKPQNEGLDGLEEVKSLRWEKPQYVTIKRDRPSTPEPEEEEEEDEVEEEEYQIPVNEEPHRGDYAKSQGGAPVEYVTIRRGRPTTPSDRSRKTSTESEVEEEDQEVTTEIRPVYTSTTESVPEPKIQRSRDHNHTGAEEDNIPYVEVNSLNRRRFALHDNDIPPPPPPPFPIPDEGFIDDNPSYLDDRITDVTSTENPNSEDAKSISTTLSDEETTEINTTTTEKRRYSARRRGTTTSPTTTTQLPETDPQVTDTWTTVQTQTPPTSTPAIETTSPTTVPDTIPSPTKSGTTERQKIAINRVPYIAIAALREQKFEKVMEELPVGFTMTIPANDTTEKIFVDVQSEKTVDKISEVNRFKYVTVVDNSQTDISQNSTQQNIISNENIDAQVTETLPNTETAVTKQNISTETTTLEVSSSTEASSSSLAKINNARRQGNVRTPGVDDFKRRRTRPTYTRSTTEVSLSSTQSTFSQRRRGQRIRPRPYKSTSTTATDEETPIISNDTNKAEPTTEALTPDSKDNSIINRDRTTEATRFSPRRDDNDLDVTTTAITTESITTLYELENVEGSNTESVNTSNSTSSSEMTSEKSINDSLTSKDDALSNNNNENEVRTTTIFELTEPAISNTISTDSETKLDFTNTISETIITTELPTKPNEIFRRSTLRPSTLKTSVDPTRRRNIKPITSTTEEPSGRGDKLRIKKRRRRPFTRTSESPDTTTQSSTVSINNPIETSATPFATDALLERENYDVTTINSIGGFVTTIDREDLETDNSDYVTATSELVHNKNNVDDASQNRDKSITRLKTNSGNGRRLVRRKRPSSTTAEPPSEQNEAAAPRVRKVTFPRRRQTTTPVPVTTTIPPSEEKGELQLLESKDNQATEEELDDQELSATTKLPDLANSAVAAIHNLATAPPSSQASTRDETRTAPALLPRRGSTVFVREQTSPAPTLPPPRRGSTLYVEPTAISPPVSPRLSTAVSSPRPKPTRAKLPPIVDYEYYDDDDVGILDVAPVSGKVKIHSDGYIECLDRGNFPHPFSCKKFISCAKMENGELLGWEYTCPRQLSFDPIGGICNWSAGLGCKE
ncbi:hypothetical protein L9F63_000322, partial [Diploptera punctata]